MKKLFVLSVAAALFSTAVYAQMDKSVLKADIKTLNKEEKAISKEKRADRREMRQMNGAAVSHRSVQAFTTDFGNMDGVSWNRSKSFDEATFVQNGQVMTAYYDGDSKLVGTTTTKSFTNLPARAQQYINKKFGAYIKGPVILFDDNEANETDMVLFGTSFADRDLYFITLSKDGKNNIYQVDMNGDVSFFKNM